MKRALYILMIGVLAAGIMAAGGSRAEAMNNESAALLAGGIALFGGAVLNAVTHPAPVYAETYPTVYYGYSYRPVRTRVVYVAPAYRVYRGDCDHDYDYDDDYDHDRYEHRRWRHNDRW
ncbi:MAG: hypothetical protein M0Z79_01550 [Nitrospiraceae bacterium]|nr:hypothetical protein [Nitrospiraceae bacterium]